jgi:glycosyltransferase involved in cell wall biosynthesis
MVSGRLDRIVAVTGNVGRSLMEAGVSVGRIESIPMCVDTRRFHPGERGGSARFFADSGDAIRLLHVGNASREKGLIPLLHAVRLLLDKGTRVFLVAAVENQSKVKEYATGYRTAKQRVEEWGIGGHVRFVGLVDHIEDLYAESDILVIPWETSRGPSDYPMVALEAMAMGKCVVATPVGGCPELLLGGDAGVLAGGFSSEEIAAAIGLATKNARHREKRSEQAARRRAEEFSVTACADRHLAVYERLSREKARP